MSHAQQSVPSYIPGLHSSRRGHQKARLIILVVEDYNMYITALTYATLSTRGQTSPEVSDGSSPDWRCGLKTVHETTRLDWGTKNSCTIHSERILANM